MTGGTRRWLAAAAALLAALSVAGLVVWAGRPRSPAGSSGSAAGSPDALADLVRQYVAGQRPDAPYRPPDDAERRRAVAGLVALLDRRPTGEARQLLVPLGFTVSTATDPVTGRGYALVMNELPGERSWGGYLLDTSTPPRLAVEVPHPSSDVGTEQPGLALYRRVPGSVLLIAGAHRRAGAGAGDVAHQPDSLFNAVATELATRNVPQVQLHGFHDANLPDADVVISPGPGEARPAVRRLAQRVEDGGLAVCRSWREDCGRLEGTTNEQGRTGARLQSLFVHVEISRTVRDDPAKWTSLVAALAAELGG